MIFSSRAVWDFSSSSIGDFCGSSFWVHPEVPPEIFSAVSSGFSPGVPSKISPVVLPEIPLEVPPEIASGVPPELLARISPELPSVGAPPEALYDLSEECERKARLIPFNGNERCLAVYEPAMIKRRIKQRRVSST